MTADVAEAQDAVARAARGALMSGAVNRNTPGGRALADAVDRWLAAQGVALRFSGPAPASNGHDPASGCECHACISEWCKRTGTPERGEA